MVSKNNNDETCDILNSLHDMISSISCHHDLEELEEDYLRYITPLIPSHAVALYYFKPNKPQPIRIAANGVDEDFLSYYEIKGRNLDPLRGWITTNRTPYLSQLLLGLKGWQDHPIYRVVGTAAIDYAMQSPLICGNEIIGTLNFGRDVAEGIYTKLDLQAVSILSQFLGLAIPNSLVRSNLSNRQQQFCQAMENVQQGIVIADSDHKVQYANKAAQKLISRTLGPHKPARRLSLIIRDAYLNNGESGTVKEDKLLARFCPVPGSKVKQTIALLDEIAPPSDFAILQEYLTGREIDVLRLVEQGMQNREIAEVLYVSINTIKRHLDNIYCKLRVNSRTELIAKVYRLINCIG
jgi:DNA-binding CsgD family transcriptional regulator